MIATENFSKTCFKLDCFTEKNNTNYISNSLENDNLFDRPVSPVVILDLDQFSLKVSQSKQFEKPNDVEHCFVDKNSQVFDKLQCENLTQSSIGYFSECTSQYSTQYQLSQFDNLVHDNNEKKIICFRQNNEIDKFKPNDTSQKLPLHFESSLENLNHGIDFSNNDVEQKVDIDHLAENFQKNVILETEEIQENIIQLIDFENDPKFFDIRSFKSINDDFMDSRSNTSNKEIEIESIDDSFTVNDLYERINLLSLAQVKLIENFCSHVEESYKTFSQKEIIENLKTLKKKLNEDEKSRVSKRDNKTKVLKNKIIQNIIICTKKPLKFTKNGVTLEKEKFKGIKQNTKKAICALIDKLVSIVKNNQQVSPRELYYHNSRLFKSAARVTRLVNEVCRTINVSRIDLNLVSSPKGFVYGNLTLIHEDGEVFYCDSTKTGTSIPNRVNEINFSKNETRAKFILVVEKFATFNHLISFNICEKYPIILITGCGYPDLKTRRFLQKLWLEIKIPVFALVDGDAYGIDIFLAYKFGTLNSAYQNHQLIVPEMKLLGIQADDIIEFRLQGTLFTENEKKKFDFIKKREDVLKYEPLLLEQIVKLEKLKIKVEIQALLDYSPNFLIDAFFPYKLRFGTWI